MNDNLPDEKEYKKYNYKLTPFKLCVLQNFPFIEADFDAITNYQLLCKVVEYLNHVINNQNTVEDNFKIMADNLNTLYNYIDTLDLQDEVNNKLDEMAESGELAEIISLYLNTKAIFGYNNINELKQANNLVNGSIVRTLGYYTVNDGGGAVYRIRSKTAGDTQENGLIHFVGNLVAEIIVNDELLLKQIGCKNETENFDNTTLIQTAINYCIDHKIKLVVDDIYLTNGNEINDSITIKGIKNYNNSCLKAISNSSKSYILKFIGNGIRKSKIINLYVNGNKDNQTNDIDGIYCTSSFSGDFYMLIKECTVINCTGNGIVFTGDIANRTLRELRIYNNEICYNNKHGILCTSLTDSQFFGNTCHNNGLAGVYLYRTGSIRINNCKCFWNGNISSEIEDLSRIPSTAFTLTSDDSQLVGKNYYTRSGKGTWQDPYVFTLLEGSWEPNVDYYELNKTYYKKYPGILMEAANDTLINNCDMQANHGDGIKITNIPEIANETRNISINNCKADGNGLLINQNGEIISYNSQGLKQLYCGIYVEKGNYIDINCEGYDFMKSSYGNMQYTSVLLKNCDYINMNIMSRQQVVDFILQTPTNFMNNNLYINGKPYVFDYDLTKLTIPTGYSLVNDGWNKSFIKIIDHIIHYNLIVNSTNNLPTNGTQFTVINVPSDLRPSQILNCDNALSSNSLYNYRNNLIYGYINPSGNFQIANTEENQNRVTLTGKIIK